MRGMGPVHGECSQIVMELGLIMGECLDVTVLPTEGRRKVVGLGFEGLYPGIELPVGKGVVGVGLAGDTRGSPHIDDGRINGDGTPIFVEGRRTVFQSKDTVSVSLVIIG